jgi:uncharacterized protein YdbL (DUF1318 family)
MNTKGLLIKLSLAMFVFLGCARLSIDSKQPIKLDVTMRLDIYQHVSKDVDSIENLISGSASENPPAVPLKTSLFSIGVETAYAQEDSVFPPDVMQAIESRKERRDKLVALEAQGVIGEDFNGLVALKGAGGDVAASVVSEENNDRKKIYGYVAEKNGAGYQETARISARRIQSDAPSGTPVETAAGVWSTK